MKSCTLARTAIRIASLVLKRDASAAHQCFRVKNLNQDEVVQFVQAWPAAALAVGLAQVRLIVADSLGGVIPVQHVAEDGCSITHYRNNNREGLIYVETSVQSDEQGLQNMFSLRDSNFLDGSFDDYVPSAHGVPGLLIEEAWKGGDGTGGVPSMLLERLRTVIRLVHPDIEPVPVRRFVAFAEAACEVWLTHPATIDAAVADRIVGNALWAMDMFPDPGWNEGAAEARWRRRLELNTRHADLLDGNTELTAEDVIAKAEATQFKGDDGEPLLPREVLRWRQLCSSYGLETTAELRRQIPYRMFSQLFVRDTAGLRLGERVRAELESAAPDRMPEFDGLDVTSGLNARSSHDANRLLDAVPARGCKPLADLVSAATRKSVERLAVPPRRQFFNPAIEIVRLAQRVRADAGDRRVASIVVELGNPELAGSPTHGLFIFLFGETLRSIATHLEDLPGGCRLVLREHLVQRSRVPDLVDLAEEDGLEEVEQVTWDPLPLRVTFIDQDLKVLEVVNQIEWIPAAIDHFALLWLLAAAPDSLALDQVGAFAIEGPPDGRDWLSPFVCRELSLGLMKLLPAHVLESDSSLIQEFVELRRGLRADLCSMGLEIARLQEFLDAWQAILRRAREDFVPDGVRSRELDAFLGCDLVVVDGSERRMMLALHPIRLRWICGYLEQTRRLAEDFLSGEAAFADGEGERYLDWLEQLTPRESPPIAVGQNGQLLYSRSELGWCEDFSPLENDASDIAFDGEAIAAIAHRIASYLDTHPYKRDGLSLLIVMPTSDTTPAEILRRLAVRANRAVRVSLHVAAPRHRWESIARSVERLSDDIDNAPRSRLFPDRDLALIDFRPGDGLAALLAGLQLDIAVVTHVLQEQIISQQNTEAPIQRPGVFDPLRDRPLRLETGSSGSSISLVMLPKYPDPVLESWSTLAVRANRSRPIAPGQPENTDLVELRVNFQDSARLFSDLHEHCHWVITLERHISREQIESVEAGSPDVLSIEDGIGANRLNTLVVSSRSGRDLIHSRLVRKLRRLVPEQLQAQGEPGLLSSLADGIYDSTRRLSPKLALQALGVARVTEEIVGLTVARNLAEDRFPAKLSSGLVAWISLDEHTDWFGGHAQIRADMCRITLDRLPDGSLAVDVLVLEGKLRQLYDGHGVVQVRRTCDFFSAILGDAGEDGIRKVDAAMWRNLVASAIESVASDAVTTVSDADHYSPEQLAAVNLLTVSDFRSGTIHLRDVAGLYSACLWESEDQALKQFEEDGVTVLRSTRFHLVDLVRSRKSVTSQAAAEKPVAGGSSALSGISETGAQDKEALKGGERNAGSSCGVSGQEVDTSDVMSHEPVKASDDPTKMAAPAVPAVPTSPAPAPVAKTSAIPLRARQHLPEAVLRRMYEDILGCFDTHQISVSAAAREDEPCIEGPASILFKVRPGTGVDPRKLAEKAASLKLILALEQEQSVSFNIDRGFVTIDVPKSPQQRYFVDAAETWERWQRPDAALSVPIGEDRFGELVELNFSSSNSPHLLVAGTTGSGKSEALNTILFGLTRHYTDAELRLMLVDPKGTELVPFEGSSYLERAIGWDDSDAMELLKLAVEEMQRRYQLFRTAGRRSLVEFNASATPEDRLPWWLIVLDEYADLTHDPQSKKDIEAELKRLAQKARAAGIHVIIATQKPSADVISTNLRSNLPAQLALRVKSSTESRVVMDEAGAENLNGKGDALLKADGRLTRVQCSRVDTLVWEMTPGGPKLKSEEPAR